MIVVNLAQSLWRIKITFESTCNLQKVEFMKRVMRCVQVLIFPNIIRSGIEATKMRNDLYRHLSWKIQSAGHEKKIVHKYVNSPISTFTKKSLQSIKIFVRYALEVFNNSRPDLNTTVSKTLETPEDWWNNDYEEYFWEEVFVNHDR
jgi:hypothetical protein